MVRYAAKTCEISANNLREQSTLEKQNDNDTPGSMNSLFSNFFRELWRGILGGVRDYLGKILGGF